MVVMVGIALFGKLINSNTDIVWSRVEKPGQFKNEEMEKYAQAFDISVEKFREIINRQKAHNIEEVLNGRPIGRERFQKKPFIEPMQ